MIKLAKPYLCFDEVSDGLRKIIDSGTLTLGENVEGLRLEISKYVGSKHCFLTTSATTALSVCLKILKIQAGDEVLVSDFSFPASANVIEDLGAVPVFVDVHADTFNLNLLDAEKKVTKKTKAIIWVDALGNPSGLEKLISWAKFVNLPVIEDAACAFGSSVESKKVGSIADLTCFSFHPRKLLTAGEGGAITLGRDDWAEQLNIKLSHGGIRTNGRFDFVDCGYNYRLTEIQSYLLRVQVKKIDEIVSRRMDTWRIYKEAIEPLGFLAQKIEKNVGFNVQSATFVTPIGVNRDSLIQKLREGGVESTIGTYSMSNIRYYLEKYQTPQPIANTLYESTLTLPCHDSCEPEKVIEVLKKNL